MSITHNSTENQRFHRLNFQMAIGYGIANLAVLLLLPTLATRNIGGLGIHWGWLALPVVLTSNGFWALLHEAIHNLFASDRNINRRAGRLMAVLFGSSFRMLRFGHLTHHRFNRHPLDRPDCFDPAQSSALAARCRFFAETFGGLYLIELLTPLLYWLPRPIILRLLGRVYAGEEPRLKQLRQLAHQSLGSARTIVEIRQDAMAALLLYALSAWLWGNLWPVLAGFILIRGFLISFLDNIYHFRTPVDRPDFAYNLRLARPLQTLILNMNFHRTHHHHMHLAWWQLPGQFRQSGEVFDRNYAHVALEQLRGPAPIGVLTSDQAVP
ncbi:fatty acid desaturase [Dongia soli]|uniref:Fatty acid desaturase n=1 Tax=Dongia soli TaxID=600628 RepID=A0ABU5EL42_9PROT|nr:fatty acid desaturase [Dongia soli]MDY0885875.1 fatty acid desaturase [Dongia soli]